MSAGDYISLGWHEKDDLAAVLDHLRATGLVTSIALWGRSMGASSAVLQASRDPTLAGLVLDSPFASLEQVALELVTSAPETVPGAPSIPPFLVKTALRVVANSVKSRAGFDLYKLRPVDAAKTCFAPSLFGCGAEDILVRPHHSQQIYDGYAGDKNVVKFEGDHNDIRPGFFQDSACIFLKQVLMIPDTHQLEDVPLDSDSRPMSIMYTFHHGAPRGLHNFDAPRRQQELNQQHQAIADQAIAQHEEQMLMQAIMASLETSSGMGPTSVDGEALLSSPETLSSPDMVAALPHALSVADGRQLVPPLAMEGIETPTPPPSTLAADFGGGGGVEGMGGGAMDEEEAMLLEAIRLSLEESERQQTDDAPAPAADATAADKLPTTPLPSNRPTSDPPTSAPSATPRSAAVEGRVVDAD
uniref:Serine aminopeptidase S33 domain-containing protein n=1 Tax=Haptolina brevifila TaxID=156173 RepID=A0A7S2J0W2_9EUKA